MRAERERERVTKESSPQLFGLRDLRILDDIRDVFYTTTGLAVSCHYPGSKEYDSYPIVEPNPYCEAIQRREGGVERCLKSDQDALSLARAEGRSRVYTCHAGLVNLVVPLSYAGRDLGALFIGQLAPRDVDEAAFDRVYSGLSTLGLEREPLWESFGKLKTYDERELELAERLLALLSKYILSVEDELCLRAQLHEKENEILRYENTQMRMRNELQDLSIRVLEDLVRGGTEPSGAGGSGAQKRGLVDRARGFIRSNFDRDISVSDVARAIYLSPNYFSTIFKEIVGEGFSNYLSRVRVEEGMRLLRETDLPIKTVVSKVGFKDYNYFNRTFRRIVGTPPAEYRRTREERGGNT